MCRSHVALTDIPDNRPTQAQKKDLSNVWDLISRNSARRSKFKSTVEI